MAAANENANKKRKIGDFDWFEHSQESPIKDHYIHQLFPLAWTDNSIHAAHGLKHGMGMAMGMKRGNDNDVNTRLWHVTDADTPPKPSFVDFICWCASAKLKQNELGGDMHIDKGGHCEVGEYESRHLRDNDDDDSESQNSMSSEDDDDNESTFAELMEEQRKERRKDKDNHQCKVKKWIRNHEEIEAHKQECKRMQHGCDETAAVALATLSEECMISSLLPFARKHVSQCRSSSNLVLPLDIGSKKLSEIPSPTPCSSWMLPFDEAIVDLGINNISSIKHGIGVSTGSVVDVNTRIPSSRQPQLVIKMVNNSLDSLPTLDELLILDGKKMNERSAEKRERTVDCGEDDSIHIERFCKNNGIDLDFVSNNSDLFHPILGHGCIHTAQQKKDKGEMERILQYLEASIVGRGDLDSASPIPKIIVSNKRRS